MTPCGHDSTRIIEETGFCFACWHEAKDSARAVRRIELEDALRRGLVVRQATTFWTLKGVIGTAFGTYAHDVFMEPYASDAHYIADHLENREHGFGFETVILHATR